MTKVAQYHGKRPAKFLELPGTNEYMEALAAALNIRKSDIWVSKRGKGGGTLLHPKLAVFFARWQDVRFAVWCDLMKYVEAATWRPTYSIQSSAPPYPSVRFRSLISQRLPPSAVRGYCSHPAPRDTGQ
uniref:KilA-N domain-containing protein n=1 Tax=Dechloromonas aromatica (strain RCB) TaxID=159087 RepID=Q47D41_DECAR